MKDKEFDSGESIVQYLELERTARPGHEQRRVNVDFPAWMISQLDGKPSVWACRGSH